MSRVVTSAVLALVASIALDSSANAQGATPSTRQVASRDPMQEGLPLRPGRTLTFTTNVGQWMSVDVSPDGQRFYPVGMTGIRAIPPVRQAQFVQTTRDHIDLRVVLDRPLTDAESAQAVSFVRRELGFPFDVSVVRVETIERGPTGKFEEFLSLLPDP